MPQFILFVSLSLLLVCSSLPIWAQDGYATINGQLMPYIVEGGDTVYLSPLAASRIYEKKARRKGREWRRYYKLVYNFAKVYPYALVAKDIVLQVDTTIKENNLKYVKKDKYVNKVCAELFKSFEKPLRNLTISQGKLLMELIDRECGITPYEIIYTFKNTYAAHFWQGIARLFDNNLKNHYDPEGSDYATEELIRQWNDDTFEQTYYEIFWEYPPMIQIPDNYRRPDVKYYSGRAGGR